MTFGTDVQRYIERKKLAMNRVVGQSLTVLNARIIERTPVDTGRLKGNWQATLDVGANNSLLTTDPDGMQTSFAAAEVARKAPGRIYYLTNNVDYALGIEFLGRSPRKSPDGMLGISVVQFPAIWRQAVRDNGGTGT